MMVWFKIWLSFAAALFAFGISEVVRNGKDEGKIQNTATGIILNVTSSPNIQ